MDRTPLAASAIVQMCHVVPDLEQACADLYAALGVGPFMGGDEVVLEEHMYRGKAQPPIILRCALVQSGDLNLELVELVSPGPSAFHDMFAADAPTELHHVAIFCDDYTATRDRFVASGYPVASEFLMRTIGVRICYIDTRALNGHMVELYPEHPCIRALFAQTRNAAATWDGTELILPWP